MGLFSKFTSGIGIDISEHHIRIAKVSVFDGIQDLVEAEFEEGLIVDEHVVEHEKLQEIFKKKISVSLAGGPMRATLLLPESRVFSSSMILPKGLKGQGLEKEARRKAQSRIPIPFKKANVAVLKGGQEPGGIRTSLYAADREVTKGFAGVIDTSTAKLIAIEANTKSIHRLITKYRDKQFLPKDHSTLMAIVDVGHSWTSVAVYTAEGSNVFSRSISYRHMGERKISTGKLSEQVVDRLIETIHEIVVYFDRRSQKIASVYLSGVEALDEKLVSTIDKITSEETPVLTLGKAISLRGLDEHKFHTFGAAIGAGIRSAFPRKYAYQHNFLKNK